MSVDLIYNIYRSFFVGKTRTLWLRDDGSGWALSMPRKPKDVVSDQYWIGG